MTSSFMVTVGNDYSANDIFSAVQLTPALFDNISTIVTFSNPIVNTSSNLLITLNTTNRL